MTNRTQPNMFRASLTFCSVLLLAPAMFAQVPNDNASNSAYNDGWQSGDNGGTGFGAWTLSGGSNAGFFIGNSKNNGDGDGNNDGDINTTGDNAWGLYANSGQTASAVRTFNSALSVGQTFTLRMDNGWIEGGGTVGFGLQNASSDNRFEFFFIGGASKYQRNDNGGVQNTTLDFTDGGLTIVFTLTGADAYSATVTAYYDDNTSASDTFSGTLLNSGAIDRLRLFNYNAGSGSQRDAFFNSIAVPEPALVSLLAISGMLLRRRARRA